MRIRGARGEGPALSVAAQAMSALARERSHFWSSIVNQDLKKRLCLFFRHMSNFLSYYIISEKLGYHLSEFFLVL